MTSRQAELINIMLSQHYNSATYKDAYSELRGTCSDALAHPTVTVSASGTATPPPPSTPTPLGPQWWKERQAEALKEQIEIIADQNKKIAELTKQRDQYHRVAEKRLEEYEFWNWEYAKLHKRTVALENQIKKLKQWHEDSIDQVNKLGRELGEKIQENERLKKELEVAWKKRKAIVDVGNNLREVMAVIINNYSLDFGDGLLAKNAIQLWEDNTTP